MSATLAAIATGAGLLLILVVCTSRALVADGFGLDRALAALWFGAKQGETISLIVAQWQAAGSVAGCRWCRFLSWAVETAHCSKQLDQTSPATPLLNGLRAGGLLLLLSAVLWAVPLAAWLTLTALWRLLLA